MKHWLTYILICPIEKEVRYVGITSVSLDKRLEYHLNETHNRKKAKWIAWLRDQGLVPLIKRIDDCYGTRKDAERRERHYVWYYLAKGCRLFNRNYNYGDGFAEYLKSNRISTKPPSRRYPSDRSYTKQQYSERTGD